MAYFAKLNENNIVIRVEKVNNDVIVDENGIEQEELGINFLRKTYNELNANWKKTSYNSIDGKYYENGNISENQNKLFRKTFAGKNFIYYPDIDAFKAPQPFDSWLFNEEKWQWESPIKKPEEKLNDGQYYYWNELTKNWEIKNF
jgi:hypothetical protein